MQADAARTPDSSSPAAGAPATPAILSREPIELGRPWPTPDPFLFCAHHLDDYPRGNGEFGPPEDALVGRHLTMDFSRKDGFSLYHGTRVPGFPVHPHRGFETVTVVRKGRLDHADSMGAAARYGDGDVQWLTAGSGIQHSEMFPLLHSDKDNPLELFQIWLNLPRKRKMATPHFKMLWAETIPEARVRDSEGRETVVTVRAGKLGELEAPAPPPESWAAEPGSEVLILTVKLTPGARWTLPGASAGLNRSLYLFEGELEAEGQPVKNATRLNLLSNASLELRAGSDGAEILVLQGRPLGEPVAQHGPFVMNTREEIIDAVRDYQRTSFGGWPWPDSEPVHGASPERFARRPDGTIERPGSPPEKAG